jgi:hypothetical protein
LLALGGAYDSENPENRAYSAFYTQNMIVEHGFRQDAGLQSKSRFPISFDGSRFTLNMQKKPGLRNIVDKKGTFIENPRNFQQLNSFPRVKSRHLQLEK